MALYLLKISFSRITLAITDPDKDLNAYVGGTQMSHVKIFGALDQRVTKW